MKVLHVAGVVLSVLPEKVHVMKIDLAFRIKLYKVLQWSLGSIMYLNMKY